MSDVKFPYPKINKPSLDLNDEDHEKLNETFDLIEGYKDKINTYIFTDITLTYNTGDERFILARIQQILSSTLLRSLYIRNGIVDSINSRNIVSLFANLKSFMEVPALLMYLHSLLDQNLSAEELLEKFSHIVFGNKGDNQLRVGTKESVNILTMFEKIEKYMKTITSTAEGNKDEQVHTAMTDFYALVCNASHPNYDAHDIIGVFDRDKGIWRGLGPKEFKKEMVDGAPRYKPPLYLTIIMIEYICKLMVVHKKVNSFKELTNPRFF